MTAQVSDINDARTPLSFALRYIGLGLWVLPLEPGTKKPLGRLVRNGFHDATNVPDTARKWWAQHPEAGIGVAVKRSGWVVVDIDPRNGGLDTIEALEAKHGPLQSDVLAFTGGGGEHRVFAAQLVENLPGTLGPGVDLKADGYIAVEPTLHPSGRRYAWEGSSDPLDGIVPTTLPGWIRDLARAPLAPSSYTPAAVAPIDARRLQSAREALAQIASDDRDAWVKVGAAINNELPGQEGFSLWDAWSQSSAKYDPQDAIRVWRSFKPRGLAGVGLNTVFAMAQAQGWKNTGGAAQAVEPAQAAGRLLTLPQLKAAAGSIAWTIKHVVPADSVGMMFGASGTFKSFIAIDMALHVAHGLPWMGRKTQRGAVVYIAAEGGAGLWRRVDAWHRARGLRWEDAPVFVLPVPVTINQRGAAEVVAETQALGVEPALIVVDTMSQTFEGEENSANEVASYLRQIGASFRALWHCVVLVIHHSGHAATERPRGSSAIVANTDFLLGVFRDETQLLATITCEKQKDGDRFDPANFELTSHILGKDSDGDEIRSLVARHLNPGAEVAEALVRQASAGRGGRTMQLVALAQNGMSFKSLRHSFYEAMADAKTDAKQKAFMRAWNEAKDQHLLELVEGVIVLPTAVDNSEGVER